MRGDDHLMPVLLRASAPLLVWGARFFLCYAFIATGCVAGIGDALMKAALCGGVLAQCPFAVLRPMDRLATGTTTSQAGAHTCGAMVAIAA